MVEATTPALTVVQPGVDEAGTAAVEEAREAAGLHWLSKPHHEIGGTVTPPAADPQLRDSWVPPSEEDWGNCQLEPLQEPEAPPLKRPRLVSIRSSLPAVRPKALYLFAGLQRKSDVSSFLRRLGWEVEDVDILRSRAQDLSNSAISDRVPHRIRQQSIIHCGDSLAALQHTLG